MPDQLAGPGARPGQIPMDASYNSIFGDDLNLAVKTGVATHTVNQPAVNAKIVSVKPGVIVVQLPNGQRQSLTTWAGKPVTQQILHKDGSVTTMVTPGISQDYLDPKGHAYKAINLSAASSSQQSSPTAATIDDLARHYIGSAQSSDPAAKNWFISWQDKMINAGFLDPKQYQRGLPDDATLKALHGVLLEAYRTQQTPDEVVSQAASNQGQQRRTVVRDYHLTSHQDVKGAAQKHAPDVIGRQPTDDEMAKITTAYNAIEYANQKAQFDTRDQELAMQTTGDPGATVPDTLTYNAPSLEQFVQDQLRSQNPIASRGMAIGQNLAAFEQMLRGAGSSAGGMG